MTNKNSFKFIIAGFAAVILTGAVILMLPISSSTGQITPFNDALFTSTSAVCVTGLIVRDTGTYWSLLGQIVIILLIQIGGLGVVYHNNAFNYSWRYRFSYMGRHTC